MKFIKELLIFIRDNGFAVIFALIVISNLVTHFGKT